MIDTLEHRTFKLEQNLDGTSNKIRIPLEDSYRLPLPSVPNSLPRNSPFKMVITQPGEADEWVECIENPRTGALTVNRGIDGSSAVSWLAGTAILAPRAGTQRVRRARADRPALHGGLATGMLSKLEERLRLPHTLYDRNFTNANDTTPNYPRLFGRFWNDGALSEMTLPSGYSDDLAKGTLSRFHNKLDRTLPACRGSKHNFAVGPTLGAEEELIAQLDDFFWPVTQRDMPMLKDSALTRLQYQRFLLWTDQKSDSRKEQVFDPPETNTLKAFFAATHTADEYFAQLMVKYPRHAPAFLDMANLGKMLGGSFMPGLEVGREAGKAVNWSVHHGAIKHFPDVRFHPQGKAAAHKDGCAHQGPVRALANGLPLLRRDLLANRAPGDRGAPGDAIRLARVHPRAGR